MDFTEIYKQSYSLVSFSSGAHFLLAAIQDRLVVRRTDSFQIIRSWAIDEQTSSTASVMLLHSSNKPGSSRTTASSRAKPSQGRAGVDSPSGSDAWITHAGWSSDSEYVMGACAKRGIVEVFKIRDEDWRARIEAGAEGLIKAEWAPGGRSIICWSEWGLRVTIWSLITGTATYIQYPAQPERGHAFRSDGHYLVLAERHKSRDTMGIYDATTAYRLMRHFPLPTSSLGAIALSPTGNYVAVCEGPLEFKVHILSLSGDVQGSFSPDRDPGFGIRAMAWHPGGLFLAIQGWDDKVFILECLTWGSVATLEMQTRFSTGVTVWREPNDWLEVTQGRGFLSYERIQPPHSISATPRDKSKPPPELGTTKPDATDTILAWNTDGTLLLVRYAGTPQAVYLYNCPKVGERTAQDGETVRPRLRAVILHASAVECARWNPVRKGSLAVCTGGGAIYLWSDEWVNEARQDSQVPTVHEDGEEVAECVGVPAKKFSAHSLRWAPDGRGLIVLDRDTFCCAFEVEDADDVPPDAA